VFRPHPDIDKGEWNKRKVIKASDHESGFPVHTKMDAVRYRYASKDEVK